MARVLRYRVRLLDPAAHLFEVRLTVESPDPKGQVFEMPAWIPGSYMIRDYARHVVAIRAESDGLDVALEKLDKSRWCAQPTARPLTVIAEIYAYDPSVRGAHLDTTHAYFNGTCMFLSVTGCESLPCELEILAPDKPLGKNWRVATSLRRKTAGPYGFGLYHARDYDELIDHPVEIGDQQIGEFEVGGIPHAIAIRGKVRVDMSRLCRDLATLCNEHMALLGKPADLDRYVFLLNAPGSGYGGLEHRWSSSLVCARENLPARSDSDVSEGYRTFLGLASHEYFHLWNVKRLKPAAFVPYNLREETHTSLLWAFEGITSYYDDLALVRCGLIPVDSYLELLGRTITRVLRGAGRLRQSVAESSFDAWTKFYKQDANSANAIVSYYAKGSLVALALDLKIRSECEDSAVSLDTVMAECWSRWGESGDGMPEDGIETVAVEVTGLDLVDFFDAAVRGTGELPLAKLLARFGIAHNLRPSAGRDDKGGKASDKEPGPWLGATLAELNGKSTFVTVPNHGPAEKAGIAPGDVAVALDGVALTSANIDQRLRTYHDGDRLDLVVFRDDELISAKVRLAVAPADTCFLTQAEDADANAMARQAAWLQSSLSAAGSNSMS